MSAKGFTFLLVGVLMLGFVVGGALLVFMAPGKNEEEAPIALTAPQSRSSGQVISENTSEGQTLDQLREQIQSGEAASDDLAQSLQQFRGGFGGAITGAIQSVSGNIVTLDTSEGSQQVKVGENTTIQQTIEVILADLALGTRVNFRGARGEDGTYEAQTIIVVPEGQQSPGVFGGRQLSQEDLAQFRQGFQGQFGQGGTGGLGGRQLSQEDLAQFRQGFRQFGQGGTGEGDGGLGDRGLSGTIGSVEQNIITVNTNQGSLLLEVSKDITIQKTVEITLADLVEGTSVIVLRSASESGDIEARTIIVIPEGQQGEFGGGFRRSRFGQAQP